MKKRHGNQTAAIVMAAAMMFAGAGPVLAEENETSEQSTQTETAEQTENAEASEAKTDTAESGQTESSSAEQAAEKAEVFGTELTETQAEEALNEISEEETADEPAGAVQNPVELSDLVVNIGADETQINVTWYSTSSTAGLLQIAEQAEVQDEEFSGNCRLYTASVTTSQTGEYINKLTVTGLASARKYSYRIYDGEKWSATYTYKTQQFGSSFQFLVMGDPQIGCSGSVGNDAAGWLTTLQNSLGKFPETAFIYSMGDQINAYYDKTNTDKVEDEYTGFLSSLEEISEVALATTVGNHDAGRDAALYSEHFTTPNSTSYGDVESSAETDYDGDYSFTYNGTLFMNLESNNLSIAEHKAFMEEAIQANPDAVWKVVTYHKSTYSVASHVTESDIVSLRTGLSPIFKELGIDLVLQGHDHVYARSYIMGGQDGMTADTTTGGTDIYNPDGVLYITANSASGSKFYKITSEAFTYTAVMNQEKVPNYTNVEINEDSFTVTTYRSTDNSIVDTVTVHKQAEEKQDEESADSAEEETVTPETRPDETSADASSNTKAQETAVQTSIQKSSGVNTGDTFHGGALGGLIASCISLAAAAFFLIRKKL